ncbi:MAG: 2-hydroxyacyl-CoA dehydratase subunit D [Anaerovoracaceae bacterium]|jgi:benzoyl-CoA reductase/2-hydroxyglutaryl-CoA dehydratase subunit BcrC/BadD/HgdB
MQDIVYKFGDFVDKNVPKHPALSRKMLIAGFCAFGLKLDHRPNPELPESRQYIASLLNDIVIDMLTHSDRAALTSVFMPCEMLQVMGIRSLCAELFSCFINGAHAEKAFVEAAENEGIAETYCSYHKVLLGSAYSGVMPKPAAIVNTSLICDANNLTFRALSDHYGIPQFYLDVPSESGEESTRYVADQLRELKTFLEDQTGKLFDEQKLKEQIACSGRTIENLIETQPYRRDRWLAGDIASELYEVYVTHIGLGTKEAETYTQLLKRDFQNAPKADGRGARILWIHTIPNWQPPIRETFNLSEDAQIIGCDMNWDSLIPMDPEHPYESMARRLTESTFNGNGERRIRAAVDMAEKLDADGAIVFCHWGCKQTMGLSAVFKDALEDAGFPTLILNGDGCDENNSSDGQIATRLSAFLEMLKERRD